MFMFIKISFRRTVSRDIFASGFFMNQFPRPPQPQSIPLGPFQIFLKIHGDISASQGAPRVSTTPAANFATCLASVVDTGVK
jgi:hypothetical protein